jgi:hypothetical protein
MRLGDELSKMVTKMIEMGILPVSVGLSRPHFEQLYIELMPYTRCYDENHRLKPITATEITLVILRNRIIFRLDNQN